LPWLGALNCNWSSRIITKRDIWTLIRLPFLFVSAWVLPERNWKWVAGGAAWMASKLKPKAHIERVKLFARIYGVDADDPSAKQAALRASFVSHASIMQCFREYRWGGWHPRILVSGREHLDAALSQGNGAIAWIQYMPYSDLIAKKALAQIGFPPHHLSRPEHGFSVSRFGVRVLNPLWTRIEDRYLSERITMQSDSATGALRTLLSRLKDNRLVSITVDADAVKTVDVSFFNARMKLATSPVALSLRHGVPLIPVLTIRSRDTGFEVIIGPALSSELEAGSADGIAAVASEYASRLETFYREHEDQRVTLRCAYVAQD